MQLLTCISSSETPLNGDMVFIAPTLPRSNNRPNVLHGRQALIEALTSQHTQFKFCHSWSVRGALYVPHQSILPGTLSWAWVPPFLDGTLPDFFLSVKFFMVWRNHARAAGLRTVLLRRSPRQPTAPLGPAIDQPGQIGQDRVTGEVREGHRTLQDDRQPHRRQ